MIGALLLALGITVMVDSISVGVFIPEQSPYGLITGSLLSLLGGIILVG